MDELPDPVQYAIPAFIILILVEMVIARRVDPSRYEPKDTMISLLLGTGSTVAGALTGSFVVGLSVWLSQFGLFEIGYVWWAWILVFLLDDLAYYVFHRMAHRVRWFWASHVIHHSSQHYNLSTALRQTWTGFFSLSFAFSLPIILLGFPVEMLLFASAVNLVYQFWIHTETIDRMPRWFEAIFNTPSHHRVHHATNPRYLDKNYAGMLIIWDRMFGTFELERDDERPRYGIIKNLGSFNLLWAAFHEWIGIAKDVATVPGIRNKIGYILRPPGWSHDGSRDTSDTIKAHWRESETGGSSPTSDITPAE